jgi:hypothetical protein
VEPDELDLDRFERLADQAQQLIADRDLELASRILRQALSLWDGLALDNLTPSLVDDPELRFTNNGIAVANMRVAVTQRIQQDGEWRDGDTSFLRVNVWRGQAEHLVLQP